MDEFLADHRIDSGKYNFISLKNGKYFISDDKLVRKRFWRLFTDQKEKNSALVFRLEPEDYMPLFFDFDIPSKGKEQISDESYRDLLCQLTECAVRLTRNPEPKNTSHTKKRANKG